MAGFHDQRDWTDRHPAPPSLPLHNRTPSDNNHQAIRMVPYSPPRLESQLSQYSQNSQTSHNSQTSQLRSSQSQHSYSLSLPLQGRASPTPSSPRSPPRRRRQRQRPRQSRELDGLLTNSDDIEGGANDSDRTATTVTSRRSKAKRPSSWGPAAAFAAAVSAVTGAASSGSRSGSSPISMTSSVSPGNDGDRSDRDQRQGSILSEKSRNIMISGNWPNAKKEGYVSSGLGSALSMPVGTEIPLARGSNMGVSGAKLASPTTTAATTTIFPNATSDTPPSNTRHSRYSSQNSQNKSSYITGEYDATSSTSSRLLAHSQYQHQPEQPQPQPYSHNVSSPTSLSSSLPRARLGLPPASASFSAAAASYLTEHSSNISNIADTLVASPYSFHSAPLPSSPASPASAYSAYSASPAPSFVPSSYPTNYSPSHPSSTFPPSLQSSLPSSYLSSASSYPSSSYPPHTITNTGASSYTLTAPSLSPSPSIGSLSSVSSSQAAAPRPHSRRRNIIAIHPDKTFSLVPRGGAAQSQPQSQPPSAIPAVAASLKSPPLSLLSFSNSATSSTIRSSVSHERLFSGAYGSGDQPSSPLTTAASATLEDPSTLESSYTPSLGSRSGSSTIPIDFDDRQPWNQRLVGGLRGHPKTPDAKRKGKARAYTFASQSQTQAQTPSQFLPSLPETSSSSPTATIVTGPFASEPTTVATSRAPKKKPSSTSVQSFASSALSFSASTLSANTNYKVYAHGSSPIAHTALQSLDSFADLDSQNPDDSHNLQDRLDSTDSLFFSSPAHPGDTTNVEILGVSSPAAPPLPELQRNTDPDQSFASLNSYPSIASFDTGISYNESTLPNFVVIGASSPPAPSRYLDQIRSTTDSDTELDAGTDIDIDISSSPPLPSRIANTTTDTLHTSDSDENYVLHGEPSSFFLPPSSSTPGKQSLASLTPAPPQTSSSSGGSSLVTISKQPRQVYSRESLIVPPLKTVRAKRSNERFGYYKSRSRESLRRAASLKSLSSSIFNQEAASTFFAGQAFLNISIPTVPVFNQPKTSHPQQHLPAFLGKTALPKLKRKPLPLPAPPVQSENIVVHSRTPKKNTRGLPADDSWESSSPPQLQTPSLSPFASQSASPQPPSPTLPQQPTIRVQMVEEHPHQWSSQLSTVMSESDDDSMDIRVVSRSVSPMPGTPGTPGRVDSLVHGDASVMSRLSSASAASNGSGGLRSSTGWVSSSHSRNMPSITSSLALQLEEMRDRNSRDSSLLDRPSPAFFRGASASPSSPGNGGPFSPPIRTVRDHDEDGDGLADLHNMSAQPSRSGLSGFFTNSSNSVRNVHTSSSMRSMRSVGSGHFPSWARVYYGSGEHRALSAAPSVSDLGQGDDYMTGAIRPNSAFRRSPSVDNGPLNLFNTRRRPREVQANGARSYSEAVDMEAGDGGMLPAQRPRGLRRITSSIWSPHLQMDRRAARFSVWDPPSVAWSDTSSRFDRRNMQVILFTIGFIMPLTWMIASVLPLPLDPKRAMERRMAESEGEYGVAEALKQRMSQADENRFQSARWWRRLNRVMSLFGLLILGAIIALVIIAVKQHWGK
ncbi:serine-rich protein [Ophiostoma piceae UAMH 11346]|uniref:Serine-rich protein n=1 Tax=Ophiostoma piceae (strain UAMH 11346) TaxID=1262450 RepID=S3C5Z0_OPHP1|nr:serine-rich protein [Ophiostoma piceae UAMH 11346]